MHNVQTREVSYFPKYWQIADSGKQQEFYMTVMNLEHNKTKILTYDDEPFPGTCKSNVNLVLISNEAEVLLAPAKSRVRLYPVIREWSDGTKYNVIPFSTW